MPAPETAAPFEMNGWPHALGTGIFLPFAYVWFHSWLYIDALTEFLNCSRKVKELVRWHPNLSWCGAVRLREHQERWQWSA